MLSELLFVQNYGPACWSHTWSLAVEEHFYILLLLFLTFLSRRAAGANPFRVLPLTFAILALASLALRLVTSSLRPYSHATHLFPTHLRMDSLFCGVVISYFYHYRSSNFLALARRYRTPAAILGVASLAPAFVYSLETTPWITTFGLTLFYLGGGLLLIAALGLDGNQRALRPLAYIGSHSYSIYLWHVPVLLLLLRVLGTRGGWPLHFALYLVAVVGVGVAMALLVEFPVLKARDRWFPSRARAMELPLETVREASPADLPTSIA